MIITWWEARQRKSCWVKALYEINILPKETNSVEGSWSPSSGFKAFQKLFAQFNEVDAVFFANDQTAYRVIHSALLHHIRIPQVLGMIRYDGLVESAHICSPISSVSQDLKLLWATCVESILSKQTHNFEINTEIKDTINLLPEIVVRDSSQPNFH